MEKQFSLDCGSKKTLFQVFRYANVGKFIRKRSVSMRSGIFVSFFIAISLIQISGAEDPPSAPPAAPSSSTPTNEATKPPAVLPVVADNVLYYGGLLGNFLKSFITGDEWSVKYVLYKLLQGTQLVGSTVSSYSESLLNSPYITIHSELSPPDMTDNKKAEATKSETETQPTG